MITELPALRIFVFLCVHNKYLCIDYYYCYCYCINKCNNNDGADGTKATLHR